MINGQTIIVAHLGYPTTTFTAPMIYNPYFEARAINAVVVPMGVKADGYLAVVSALRKTTNIRGALVTMPHKAATLALVDEASTAARIAGACNIIRFRSDGTLLGGMFDGEGFVRAMLRKRRAAQGARALVVGSGGVGSAIAAALAGAGVAALGLSDVNGAAAEALAGRLRRHYPALELAISNDPAGYGIVVNATPLGMNDGDALPMDVERIASSAFVGEVVLKRAVTPFLAAARARGCGTQAGTDMLFEQIPACLEFLGFPAPTADELRAVARIPH